MLTFSRRSRPQGLVRRSRVSRALASFAMIALAWIGASAATPTFWTVSTQPDFLKGDVVDLSIDSDGRMFLGPTASLLAETSAPFLWTVIAGADGILWAGSGNEGQVLKIARDGKLSTFFDAPELEIHAMAPAPNGGLYVGTSPDGKIYQVAADGSSKTFFDPEDKYIWALAVDKGGNVFAATGDKGSSTRSRPMARARASTRPTPATWSRSRSPATAISSPEPSPPGACSASTRPARPSCSSTHRFARSTRSA